MLQLPVALNALKEYKQFILYKLVKIDDNKTDKLPVDYRTLQVFKKDDMWQQDPNAWTDENTAINLAALCGENHGVGFFFTKNDPFFFLDIDKCLQSDKTWSPIATSLMNQLPGAAIEVSQSGKGLHIFGCGVVPDHGCKNDKFGLELYTSGRFVALTGSRAKGNASTDCSAILPTLVTTYFPPKMPARDAQWTTEPLSEYTPLKDDDQLLKKALATKSIASKFGNRATFKDLWENNIEALTDAYPPISTKYVYDQSTADSALAQHLAFWTGCNCEHILNLMWCSGLVRDKWTTHKDYLKKLTIIKAVSLQKVVYTRAKKEPERIPIEASKPVSEIIMKNGFQFLAATQQIEHFKGCVYIQDAHKVFTPNGSLLKKEQFNATYGGYVFQLDSEAAGKTTIKAWDVFTESQIIKYPIAESVCFRPELESGILIEEENRMLVNTYVPIDTPKLQSDITPFLTHLSKLLPDDRDQKILLSYMAACIQFKGVKFQWAPLIQGVQGNGKTLFTRCVAYAVGERYTHMPFASEIAEKFNDWLFDKIFIGVEDVYVPEHKLEVIEILKPMITNNRLAKRAMQHGQVMHHVCANFMLNTNHKTAIKIARGDRRFCIFYTAQQTLEDLQRDGMDGDYFQKLYDWLRAKGYSIVNNYLTNYEIPAEFNPIGRAPKTTSTDEAINASLGGVEQEIIEAIEEGKIGFSGGWVSSMALERLLQTLHATRKIPPRKRRELLQSIGYDWHPALNNGRVSSVIPLDGGKPRLYIKNGHLSCNLTTASEVIKAYQEAQKSSLAFAAMQTGNKFK